MWVVNPREKSVTAYRSRTEARRLVESDLLDGSDVLPGFRLAIDELFARAELTS